MNDDLTSATRNLSEGIDALTKSISGGETLSHDNLATGLAVFIAGHVGDVDTESEWTVSLMERLEVIFLNSGSYALSELKAIYKTRPKSLHP